MLAACAANYGTTTSSRIEWYFCQDPTDNRLAELGISSWPVEAKLIESNQSHLCRRPLPLSSFTQLTKLNEQLGQFRAHVGEDEFLAGRLYTGPLFVKYNAVLRGTGSTVPKFFKDEFWRLCAGNRYPTTLHTINSCLVKLSLLTKKSTVRPASQS